MKIRWLAASKFDFLQSVETRGTQNLPCGPEAARIRA
jgi:hypothetical protein